MSWSQGFYDYIISRVRDLQFCDPKLIAATLIEETPELALKLYHELSKEYT